MNTMRSHVPVAREAVHVFEVRGVVHQRALEERLRECEVVVVLELRHDFQLRVRGALRFDNVRRIIASTNPWVVVPEDRQLFERRVERLVVLEEAEEILDEQPVVGERPFAAGHVFAMKSLSISWL